MRTRAGRHSCGVCGPLGESAVQTKTGLFSVEGLQPLGEALAGGVGSEGTSQGDVVAGRTLLAG